MGAARARHDMCESAFIKPYEATKLQLKRTAVAGRLVTVVYV